LVTITYYSTTIYYLPGISVSLALYPHNVNKFVLIVSNFYVAKVLSQQAEPIGRRREVLGLRQGQGVALAVLYKL
jgi:hypothetical protein